MVPCASSRTTVYPSWRNATLYLIGDQHKVFETAIENMERRTGSDKIGYLLTSALLEFLAHEATRGISDDKKMEYFMNDTRGSSSGFETRRWPQSSLR